MNPLFFQNRLFADIPVDVLEATPACERDFAPETVIFRESQPGDTLMLVGSGLVQISKAGRQGQQEVLSLLEANDFFGELAVLDRGPRSATAMAVKHTVIGEIDGLHRPACFLVQSSCNGSPIS